VCSEIALIRRPAAKHARLEGSFQDRQQLVDAILRYYYYVELGIDAYKHVAPFREEWAGNALSLVRGRVLRNGQAAHKMQGGVKCPCRHLHKQLAHKFHGAC